MIVNAFTRNESTLNKRVKLVHQTGQADYEWVQKTYREHGLDAEVAPFFHDMGEVYQKVDFLVSRAGATTLTELAVLGKPAVLFPYPYAADNHQEKNALYYSEGGGAPCFREGDMSGEKLQQVISDLIENEQKPRDMSEKMRRLGCPDAAEKLVDVCLEITGRTE